ARPAPGEGPGEAGVPGSSRPTRGSRASARPSRAERAAGAAPRSARAERRVAARSPLVLIRSLIPVALPEDLWCETPADTRDLPTTRMPSGSRLSRLEGAE